MKKKKLKLNLLQVEIERDTQLRFLYISSCRWLNKWMDWWEKQLLLNFFSTELPKQSFRMTFFPTSVARSIATYFECECLNSYTLSNNKHVFIKRACVYKCFMSGLYAAFLLNEIIDTHFMFCCCLLFVNAVEIKNLW